MRRFISIALLVLTLMVLVIPAPVLAEEGETVSKAPGQLVPVECAGPKGECGISQLATFVLTVTQWVLWIMGAGSLAMFIYGGFLWITSAGSQQRITDGLKIITNTVIAIVIILLAFTAVRFIGKSLGVTDSDGVFNLYLDTSDIKEVPISCVGKDNGDPCEGGECQDGVCT